MPEDTEDQTANAATAEVVEDEQLRDAGKAALQKERDRAKAAEARIRELETAQAARDAEAQKRADAEAAEQGKWKELAEKRDADLGKTTESLKTVESERDALADYFRKDYEAALKNLPEVIREFAPDDDASVATKTGWLAKAKAQAEKLDKASAKGNGQNPKTGAPGTDEEAARAASSARFRSAL